jgi:hypothetical protein
MIVMYVPYYGDNNDIVTMVMIYLQYCLAQSY